MAAGTAILHRYGVADLLIYSFERQETHCVNYAGRGRGGVDRPQQEKITVRYQLTVVEHNADALAAHEQTLSWHAYVANTSATELTLVEAVLAYRDEWLIELCLHRLKGASLSLDPLFVKRDDEVVGLTNLLSVTLRPPTLIEFVVRHKLRQNQEQLVGFLP